MIKGDKMSKEIIPYSQEERIELLKENLNQVIEQSDLSVSILYYVLQGYMKDFETLYHQYQSQLFQSLNEKLEHNGKVQLQNSIEEELREESPELKVTKVEKKK